jgi:acylphosphatase
MQTIRIRVTGKVQGVWYRQHAKERAVSLALTGTVQNLSDGSVEIIATGAVEQLDQLLDWCRSGPPKAKVAEVESEILPLLDYHEFSIKR